jgi:hypothetical protein
MLIKNLGRHIDASAVLVAEAAKVAPSDLTIPEHQHIDTTLDITPSTKRVRLSLPDQGKTVAIGDNLGEK